MKNLRKAFMIAGLLTLGNIARPLPVPQANNSSNFSSSSAPSIETGAMLYVELSKSLDAKKVKKGDTVTAQLVADVLSHGKIVAQRDSKLVGHITEAQPYSKEKPESRLGIAFEKLILKGGQEIQFSSVLVALRPVPNPPASMDLTRGTSTTAGRDFSMPLSMAHRNSIGSNDAKAMEMANSGPAKMDGFRLTPSAVGETPIVVSLKRTIKLESGVIIELRVTGSPRQ